MGQLLFGKIRLYASTEFSFKNNTIILILLLYFYTFCCRTIHLWSQRRPAFVPAITSLSHNFFFNLRTGKSYWESIVFRRKLLSAVDTSFFHSKVWLTLAFIIIVAFTIFPPGIFNKASTQILISISCFFCLIADVDKSDIDECSFQTSMG